MSMQWIISIQLGENGVRWPASDMIVKETLDEIMIEWDKLIEEKSPYISDMCLRRIDEDNREVLNSHCFWEE